MAPTTCKQWVLTRNDIGFDGLNFCETQIPEVGEGEVLVKLNATTLNYRDLVIAKVHIPILSGVYYTGYSLKIKPGNIPPSLQPARRAGL